jgi:hypothetical protein
VFIRAIGNLAPLAAHAAKTFFPDRLQDAPGPGDSLAVPKGRQVTVSHPAGLPNGLPFPSHTFGTVILDRFQRLHVHVLELASCGADAVPQRLSLLFQKARLRCLFPGALKGLEYLWQHIHLEGDPLFRRPPLIGVVLGENPAIKQVMASIFAEAYPDLLPLSL